MFDIADDIVLIDLNVDDLLKRLREGKVYIAERARAQAADNFFKKGNLIALRELALRRTAERIDAQRDEYDFREGIRDRLPVADKILVCIGPDPLSAKLVRTAKRVATSLKAPWVAVYIENARHYRLNGRGQHALAVVFRLVERLGGKVVVLQGDNAVDELINYAHTNHITKIVVGKPIKPTVRTFLEGSLSDKIIRRSGDTDVYVVTSDPNIRHETILGKNTLSKFKSKLYGWSFLAVAFATAIGIATQNLISASDQALVYLAGVVIVAARFGMGPALLYAFLSASCLNFFFIEPLYSFTIYDRAYWITLLVMLMTGVVIANQASKLRLQTILSRRRELNTQALYALTKELASTRGEKNITATAAKHIAEALDVGVAIWLVHTDGQLAARVGELPHESLTKENGALLWCFDNNKPAGRATDTMPTAAGFYLPILSTTGAVGVLGVFPKNQEYNFSAEEVALLETITNLLAAALERVKASELAERSTVEAESERLRNTLLNSVSHDLRTPLASITGASSSIAMDYETLPSATVPILVLSARGQEQDKVTALELGADDYLTKPFGAAELLARIKVAQRHLRQSVAEHNNRVESGALVIDLEKRLVTIAGAAIDLTPTEYKMLSVLALNAGKVVTNKQLLQEVWGRYSEDNNHYLRVYAQRLRRKLDDDPMQPKYIITEAGVGYRLKTA